MAFFLEEILYCKLYCFLMPDIFYDEIVVHCTLLKHLRAKVFAAQIHLPQEFSENLFDQNVGRLSLAKKASGFSSSFGSWQLSGYLLGVSLYRGDLIFAIKGFFLLVIEIE
ncbi:hypothetical protein POM88_028312 [Heracleum sosnowskyi]|uniref:Uncharacterized protein n=1 Tax=Heracleum sosnowskyi TaxID=360622 RepID=A0AAD8IBV4_9APIA|nr:hypothetical protein POM88_028312 [Heracleum sosnowskyi]